MATWVQYVMTLVIGLGAGLYAASSHYQAGATGSVATAEVQQPRASGGHNRAPTRWSAPSAAADAESRSEPSTLAEILLNPSDFEQTAALYNLGLTASRQKLEALIEEAAGLGQVSERRAATSILYSRFAELDPEAAVDHILSRGGVHAERWLSSVFHAWSRQDLQAAIERMSELSDRFKAVAGSALLNARDDLSAQERYEIAGRLGIEGVMQRLESQRQIATTDTDPDEAWRAALATEDPQYRMQRLMAVAHSWANSDPLAAMNSIGTLTDANLRRGLQQQVVSMWSQRDPQAAVEWTFAQAPSNGRANMLATALGALASTQPQDAIGLADSLSGRERQHVLGSVLQGWASKDPRAAATWFESTNDSLPANVAASLSAVYASQYPDEAFEWAISLPPSASEVASMTVISMISRNAPALAADLAQRIPDEKVREQVMRNIDRRRAFSDRAGVVDFLRQVPPGSGSNTTIATRVVGTPGNLQAAESFGQLQSDGQRRDAMLGVYRSLLQSDPERAERLRIGAGVGAVELDE